MVYVTEMLRLSLSRALDKSSGPGAREMVFGLSTVFWPVYVCACANDMHLYLGVYACV